MASLAHRVRSGALHPASLGRELVRRDVAYAGFLVCGAVLVGALLLRWLPVDGRFYAVLEAAYRLPMLGVLTAAALVGISFTASVWREWALLALVGLTIAVAALPGLVARWPAAADGPGQALLALYTLAALALPLRWWAIDRRRLRRRFPPQQDTGW